ncbi:MAG: Wzz/FepE/Etk N-terminal domain-containing protein [Bacteroidota bacterium]
MDLILLYKALLRRKLILIIVPLVAMAAGFALTIGYKPIFRSKAQLSTGFTVTEEVAIISERFNLYEVDVKFNNLIETINSPKVFSLLSYRAMLHDLNPENKPFREIKDPEKRQEVMSKVDIENVQKVLKNKLDSIEVLNAFEQEQKNIIDLLKAYKYRYQDLYQFINVSRIGGTDYVSIVAFTEDPELSAFFVNILSEEFLRFNLSIRSEKSVESVQLFANLVEQKQKALEDKSEELRAFKSSNRVINFEMESSSIIEQISELENQRDEENRNITALNLEIRDLEARIKDANFGNSRGTSSNSSNAEIVELRNQITNLRNRYSATGSSNTVLYDSIQDLRRQLDRKLAGIGGTSQDADINELIESKQNKQVQLQIANQNLVSIQASIRNLKASVGGFASKEAQIAALEREVNVATQEYLSAQEKYNTALNVAYSGDNSFRQLLYGQPAAEPEPSKRLIVTALSGISTFVLCVIIIAFLEYLDVSIRTPSNFPDATDMNLLGSLIQVDLKKKSISQVFNDAKKNKGHDQFREFLRKLRFEIENSGKKVFLFTSTKPGEGKSTLIQALALTLTLSRKRVLIVDTNFTNNTLTEIYKAKPVLEEHIVDASPSYYDKALSKTDNKRIDVIGCKGGAYSPSEILPKHNFLSEILSHTPNYDYIFLEAAPVNQYSDAKELAQYVQGVIAVVSAKSVIRQIDHESINYLKGLKSKFLGAILNNVAPENIEQ